MDETTTGTGLRESKSYCIGDDSNDDGALELELADAAEAVSHPGEMDDQLEVQNTQMFKTFTSDEDLSGGLYLVRSLAGCKYGVVNLEKASPAMISTQQAINGLKSVPRAVLFCAMSMAGLKLPKAFAFLL